MSHYLKNPSRQYRVGIGSGYHAFRTVRKDGTILWLRHKYQSNSLIPYIGRDIFLWDGEGRIQIHEGGFDARNRPMTWGKWICTLGE